jgi:molybdopterin-containing oxidoreductase family iron-sulfur binding subunit
MPPLKRPDPGPAADPARLADWPQLREFVAQRFPAQLPLLDQPVSRRRFCELMGASLALAGLPGCFWPETKLAPAVRRREGRSPGVPAQYATAFELSGVAEGLLVKSYDGRPIKIEGNSRHATGGGSSLLAQALVLELYDPARSRRVLRRTQGGVEGATWDDLAVFLGELRARLAEGRGLCVLSEASSSVTLARLRAKLLAARPAARWFEYEPLSRDNEREGTRALFGAPCRPLYRLDRADVILSLDEDLLGAHPAALDHTRDFAARRDPDGRMNRLYVLESGWSITGAAADRREALRPSEIERLGRGLAAASRDAAPLLRDALREVRAHRGRSLIAAGPRQSAAVHAAVHRLNLELDNRGSTVVFLADPDPGRPAHVEAVAALAAAIEKGEVDTLLILGGNPAYDAPAELQLASKIARLPNSLHLSLYDDETSQACSWRLPRAHALESWGDARAWDGTLLLQQPLLDPLYDGKTPAELLALLLDEPSARGYDLVRSALREVAKAPDFEGAWKQAVHDGVVQDSAWPVVEKAPLPAAATPQVAPASGLEVVFARDHRVHDGRFANNGWLQETPDPIARLTWDNAAFVSPATARARRVSHGDLARLELEGRTLEIAVFVLPGVADEAVVLPLGYGRAQGGPVAGGVGFNTYLLRTGKAPHFASGARLTATGATHRFAATQDHGIVSAVAREETARRQSELIRAAEWETYKARPHFAQEMEHHPPLQSLFSPPQQYMGHRWGMVVDLARCTGCGACVVACQAENNVPVVGKEQVLRGRQMQWLRVDRYFATRGGQPSASFQPLPCMQCENAPCEQVCPVAATVHSGEGLNEMVYSRCIGTRYCSNNCPYKVRRFNWFNNQAEVTELEKLGRNPEVTVRSRGVMEKCTYCVQRIEAARAAARLAGREPADGEIVPACAQACPAGAIVFGDLNDPASRVAALAASPRAYALLARLNTQPRTRYLAKVWNKGAAEAGT